MHHTLNGLSSWSDKYLITYLFLWLKYPWIIQDIDVNLSLPIQLNKIAESLVLLCTRAYFRHLNNTYFGVSLSMKF